MEGLLLLGREKCRAGSEIGFPAVALHTDLTLLSLSLPVCEWGVATASPTSRCCCGDQYTQMTRGVFGGRLPPWWAPVPWGDRHRQGLWYCGAEPSSSCSRVEWGAGCQKGWALKSEADGQDAVPSLQRGEESPWGRGWDRLPARNTTRGDSSSA